MKLDEIFKKKKKKLSSFRDRRYAGTDSRKGDVECPVCKTFMTKEEMESHFWICPNCGNYFTMSAVERILSLCDEDSFHEMNRSMMTQNPLQFPDYEKKLKALRKKTGQADAFVAGVGKIQKIPVAVGVLDSRFLMGSMGTAVGEKIARLTEFAGKKQLPLIIFSASGGARMQEGLFSLMQMAKTAAAVGKFKDEGGLFISFLTNPTTGGVSASYASLGDIILAEPNALIGFAGPRVIEQTIGRTLPEGFQRSEFLLEHGMIDGIVPREEIRPMLAKILMLHHRGKRK